MKFAPSFELPIGKPRRFNKRRRLAILTRMEKREAEFWKNEGERVDREILRAIKLIQGGAVSSGKTSPRM